MAVEFCRISSTETTKTVSQKQYFARFSKYSTYYRFCSISAYYRIAGNFCPAKIIFVVQHWTTNIFTHEWSDLDYLYLQCKQQPRIYWLKLNHEYFAPPPPKLPVIWNIKRYLSLPPSQLSSRCLTVGWAYTLWTLTSILGLESGCRTELSWERYVCVVVCVCVCGSVCVCVCVVVCVCACVCV